MDTFSFNLAILFTPRFQDMAHWLAIKSRIDRSAPDIETRIVNNELNGSSSRRWQATRPSLVFSVFPVIRYRPSGGRVYAAAHNMPKSAEIERLVAGGIPVPRTLPLRSNTLIDRAAFGDYVIAKPLDGYQGRGIKLVAVEDLQSRFMELTENLSQPMIVQEFIDAELDQGRPVEYRVYTVLGEPFCALRRTWLAPRPPLGRIAGNRHAAIATSTPGLASPWTVCRNPEVAALARRVAPLFDEIPCLGVDMIRQRETGKLYVLEVDSRGTDILSIPHTKASAAERAPFFEQFGGLDGIADRLVRLTRQQAC